MARDVGRAARAVTDAFATYIDTDKLDPDDVAAFARSLRDLTQAVADQGETADSLRASAETAFEQAWDTLACDEHAASAIAEEGFALGMEHVLRELGLAGDLDLQRPTQEER